MLPTKNEEELYHLGKMIRRLRKTKGLTQVQLSKAIGVSRTYLSEIESGDWNITVLLLKRIMSEFGYDVIFLENEVESEEKKLEMLIEISKIIKVKQI